MLLFWPVAIPFMTAVLTMLAWRSLRLQRAISVTGGVLLLASAIAIMAAVAENGPVAAQAGGWPAPFGITMVADWLSAVMVLITGIMAVATLVYGLADVTAAEERQGHHPLTHGMLAGICGAFLTGDIFNMYVWFEVMLMSSFVLLALGGEKKQMMGALQYVALNLISSIVFLSALGLLYGLVGSLNMADVAVRLPQAQNDGLVAAICSLLALAFGIKAAVFPVYVWLPSSYHTPPTIVSALFAGLLTKVGVYALIRSQVLFFDVSTPWMRLILLAVGILTMVFGVMGAVAQGGFRRVLSFHIVSQIGYMILGLAWMTPMALAATVFYVLHHILVKTNLFFIAGIARRHCHTEELSRMGGLYARYPGLALLFLIPAMSLAGLPPLSGFWAKLFILKAGVDLESWWPVVAALVVGFFTLFSMLKLWNEAFWKSPPEELPDKPDPAIGRQRWRVIPVVMLAGGTVAFGVFAGPVLDFSLEAAKELLNPQIYVDAVLGDRS